MSRSPTLQTIRRIFDAVVREAERNPAFAQALAQAVGEAHSAPQGTGKPRPRSCLDLSQLHAINILRTHGEPALRGKLEQLTAVEDLKRVAAASGLVLSGGASKARPSRAELIAGIIDAAKHYDAQRGAATA